tara:strand:+ start:27587 stop:27898 length:312 start_codon:yes stop_codon:yes gene_type:complete
MTDLSFHVRQFVPECADGEEMDLRTALLVARDYAAMLRSRVGTEWALTLAAEAHDMAGKFAFANASLDRLKVVRDYCRNLVQAAMLTDWMDRSNWLDFGGLDQ